MPENPSNSATTSAAAPTDASEKNHSTGRRLFRGLLEVVELQTRIIGLKILATLQASLLRLGLLFAALAAGITGIVFLYIAIFQALEMVLPTVAIFLIFTLFHFFLAIGLVMGANRITDQGYKTNGVVDKLCQPPGSPGASEK